MAAVAIGPLVDRSCPRQDSNLRTWFRKPLLYPLSYGGNLPAPRASAEAAAEVESNGLGLRGGLHRLRSQYREHGVPADPDKTELCVLFFGGVIAEHLCQLALCPGDLALA